MVKFLSKESRIRIVTLKESGKTWREIQMMMRNIYNTAVSIRGMKKLMKNYKEIGTVDDKARSGRPPVTNNRENRLLRRICLADRRKSLASINHDFFIATSKCISKVTVNIYI